MALNKEKFSKIPTDAIILSEEDALRYQLNLIQKWKKNEDVYVQLTFAVVIIFYSLYLLNQMDFQIWIFNSCNAWCT